MLNANDCRQKAEQFRELARATSDLVNFQQLVLQSAEFDVEAAALELYDAALSEAAEAPAGKSFQQRTAIRLPRVAEGPVL